MRLRQEPVRAVCSHRECDGWNDDTEGPGQIRHQAYPHAEQERASGMGGPERLQKGQAAPQGAHDTRDDESLLRELQGLEWTAETPDAHIGAVTADRILPVCRQKTVKVAQACNAICNHEQHEHAKGDREGVASVLHPAREPKLADDERGEPIIEDLVVPLPVVQIGG